MRWELDLRGHEKVGLFVSGGIDERAIVELRDVVDGFGVGASISSAPIVDFAMDIVEMEGKPFAKRGKWSGAKQVYRCPACSATAIVPLSAKPPRPCPACGAKVEPSPLLAPLLEAGRLVTPLPSVPEMRSRTLARLEPLSLGGKEASP